MRHNKMFAFLSIVVALAMVGQARARKLMLDGYWIISTFEVVQKPESGRWLVKFPADQGQIEKESYVGPKGKDLVGVDSVCIFVGVDRSCQCQNHKTGKKLDGKIHQTDLKPVWAALDANREYYVGTIDRSDVPEEFCGIFWAKSGPGVYVWVNCDPAKSKVDIDPHSLFTGDGYGDYSAYWWKFPALEW